jgi:DNA polymerase I-like protein with 3'-5' exonuclease and polymerase domains
MFLPVIYGQSAQALGHRLKVALPTAEKIVTRIRELFPTALAYTRAVHRTSKGFRVRKKTSSAKAGVNSRRGRSTTLSAFLSRHLRLLFAWKKKTCPGPIPL